MKIVEDGWIPGIIHPPKEKFYKSFLIRHINKKRFYEGFYNGSEWKIYLSGPIDLISVSNHHIFWKDSEEELEEFYENR